MSTITCKSRKLQDIITLKKGKPPAEQPYFGQDAELYLTPEYLRGKAPSEPAKPSANAVRVVDGDTIVLWDGSNAGEFFRARKGILASTMSLIEHEDTFDKEYFFYAVKNWESHLKGQTSGSGIPHVDKEVIGKLEIFQFAKPEQAKIAEILSTVDRVIEQTEALIAKQQRIKTGLMQDLLTRGIDEHGNVRSEETHEFKDCKDCLLGRIPIEWIPSQIGNVVTLQRGHDITENELRDGPYPVVSSSGIIGYHNQFTSKGPNVVVGRKGTIGKVHYIEHDFWAHDTSLYVTNFRRNNERYIFYLFNYLDLAKYGTKSGSPSLNRNDIHPLWIGLPSPDEQNQIITILVECDHRLDSSNDVLRKLRSLKTGLMQDLLTGKRRVTALLNEKERTNS